MNYRTRMRQREDHLDYAPAGLVLTGWCFPQDISVHYGRLGQPARLALPVFSLGVRAPWVQSLSAAPDIESKARLR